VGVVEVTSTVTDLLLLPPLPEQERPKVELALRGPTDCDPDTALLPAHAPFAVHPVALVADQFKVTLEPLATELLLEVSVTTGAGATATVTESAWVPPAPVQVRVYVVC
jgi:hypothetical protein